MGDGQEVVTDEREQVYLYGPERTVCPDPTKLFRHVQRYMLAMIQATALEKRDAYLDYGCGSGYGTELVALYFKRTLGIDRDASAVAYAREHHTRSGAVFLTDYHAVNTYDLITCIEVIEHLDDVQRASMLDRFRALLDKDGTLVLTTPIGDGIRIENPHHLIEFTAEQLEALLKTRFNDVEVQDISLGLPNMIALCRGPKK